MGECAEVTEEYINEVVDEYLQFLKDQQDQSPGVNFQEDMFRLEAARQHAIRAKMRNTE